MFSVTSPVFVSANSIFEYTNDFYAQHRNYILPLRRNFVANSDNTLVSVRNAPGSELEIALFENGEIVFVEFSCLYDGEFWGLVVIHENNFPDDYGWVNLDEFLVLYDYVSFEKDHVDELHEYTGNFENIDAAGAMIAWQWPGSGVPLWTIDRVNTSSLSIAYAYMDDDGREWGFIRYIFGGGNIWVCLSDPLNPDIPAFNPAPPPGVWLSDTEHTDIATLDGTSFLFPVILVSVVAVTSIVLIFVLWTPNKKNTKVEVFRND